tara:strand:+ start:472 stop:750 length:279 start_codon:yes stop_codon:yes gene_type:complete
MEELELELTSEQESELHKTVEMVLKGMLLTMHKHQDQNDWLIDLTGRSDWDVLCWTVAAGAMEEVQGYSVSISECGYKQTWSVNGRDFSGRG